MVLLSDSWGHRGTFHELTMSKFAKKRGRGLYTLANELSSQFSWFLTYFELSWEVYSTYYYRKLVPFTCTKSSVENSVFLWVISSKKITWGQVTWGQGQQCIMLSLRWHSKAPYCRKLLDLRPELWKQNDLVKRFLVNNSFDLIIFPVFCKFSHVNL
jgi:hypothetical protein